MHKYCNTNVRAFTLQPSEVARSYVETYGSDENHDYNMEIDDDYIASCGDIILVKIGYDSDKKPLYKFLVGDGARPLKDLGYIVPPNTIPTYGVDEIEDPMCMKERMNKGILFDDDTDTICNEDVCDQFCLYEDDEEYSDDEDMEVLESNKDGSYTLKEKRDNNGNILAQQVDIEF